MASGKPICANVKMGYCPITKYELGVEDMRIFCRLCEDNSKLFRTPRRNFHENVKFSNEN